MKYSKLLITCSMFFAIAVCIAQPTIKSQTVAGGSGDDLLSSIDLATDGGWIACGNSNSGISGEKTSKSKGLGDFWIVKYDKKGNVKADLTIGGRRDDGAYKIHQTTDGGFIIGGISASNQSGDKTEDSRGGTDIWVIKLSSAGKIQWQRTIGTISNDFFGDIIQTSDGGYFIGASSASDISGEKTQNSKGGSDFWIIKLNASGNILWDKTIGGNSADFLNSIAQTTDGGFILGGNSVSNISSDKSENSKGGTSDYWIVKTNSTGSVLWDKTFGGSLTDNVTSIKQTADGGFIIGGNSNSDISGDKTQNSRGTDNFFDFWVIKLNSSGNLEWDKTIGGNDDDQTLCLEVTTDGGYVLGGFSVSNISDEKSENSRGGGDFWIIKLNSTGNLQWNKTIGGSDQENLTSIKEIKPNQYVLAGWSRSGISGDKTIASRGIDDYWTVIITDNTTIANESAAENITTQKTKTLIYPNPVKDILHIQNAGKSTYALINQLGKIVFTKVINSTDEINISQLPAGLYYLRNNSTGEMQKIIITK